MKKFLSLLCFVLVLALTASSALAYEADANLNAVGESPICKETVKLTIGVGADPTVDDWDTNWMTQQLEQEGNFDLSFVTFTPSEYLEKINVMVAAGGDDLPDVLCFYNGVADSTVYAWAQAGAIIPLTEYYQNCAKHVYDSLNTTEQGAEKNIELITSPDGNIYGLPKMVESMGNVYGAKIWMYKPWLEAVGMNVPTNAEELYSVLKAFKEQDPNGNGKADELPMLSYSTDTKRWRNALVSLFETPGATYNHITYDDNGQVYGSYATENYREALRYIKKQAVCVYYQINYMRMAIPGSAAYFHAQFRRENPLPYKKPFAMLENIRGCGQYVGTYMIWGTHNNGWWGEGEVKAYLDGDGENPSICYTGTEDYFCGSYNFENQTKHQYETYSTAYSGLAQIIRPDGLYHSQMRFGMYRWHVTDPICFEREIRLTIQALGWRDNHRYLPLQDDISCASFFYLDSPACQLPELGDSEALALN